MSHLPWSGWRRRRRPRPPHRGNGPWVYRSSTWLLCRWPAQASADELAGSQAIQRGTTGRRAILCRYGHTYSRCRDNRCAGQSRRRPDLPFSRRTPSLSPRGSIAWACIMCILPWGRRDRSGPGQSVSYRSERRLSRRTAASLACGRTLWRSERRNARCRSCIARGRDQPALGVYCVWSGAVSSSRISGRMPLTTSSLSQK